MNRPRLGSRATALTAALVVLVGASLVADRFGAPAAVTAVALFGLALTSTALAGLMTRTTRLNTFRLAGYRLGWTRGGSLLLVLLAGLADLTGVGFSAAAAPIAAGILLALLIYAPLLRRAGSAGLGGFAQARYGSPWLAMLSGLLAGVAGLALAMWLAPAAISGFAGVVNGPAIIGQIAFGLMVFASLLPGGLASLAASAVIVALLALAGWLAPAALVLAQSPQPIGLGYAALLQVAQAGVIDGQAVALAALVAGLVAWSGAGQAMRSVALGRQVGAGLIFAGFVLTAAPLLTRTAAATAAGTGALPLPHALVTLNGLTPPLVLTMIAALAIRMAVAGLIDDVIYRASGYIGTVSGRLALHRLAALAALAVCASGWPTVAALWADVPRSGLHAAAVLLAGWPAILLLPAGLARVDWRTPAIGALLLISFCIAVALEAWPFALWVGVAAVAGGVMAAALLLPVRRREESARAAAILRGAQPGPLAPEADA